jgi:hypothetical protein
MFDCEGVPCVDAQANRHKLRLAVDTGNIYSLIDVRIAKAVGFKNNEPAHRNRGSVNAIVVGGATLEHVPVIVLDASGSIRQHEFPKVDGTLAFTAFGPGRLVQFDFVHHRMRVSALDSASPECLPTSCDTFSYISFNAPGPPVLVAQGFAINGHSITGQIDTMYPGSVLIYSAAISKTGLVQQAQTTKLRTFPFTDGGVKMKEAEVESEVFHDTQLRARTVYFPTPGVHEPDARFDATIGLEAFRDAVLTLDFGGRKIWVER